MLTPNTRLAGGRYIIQRHLGSGAMADVYLATDTSRQVPVALKMLRPDLALDSAFEDYFRREAQVMQALQHPNIVRMYEPLRDGEMLCLVLDYIDGPNLQRYLFGKKLLPIADALHIAQVLATALDYAHANGVIHRDLKPANVLLASNGTILLSDFGIARVASGTTTAAGMVGSPAYMSPEQIQSGAVTPASDQYSLAVLLWELTTGRRPFVGATPGLRGTTLGERVLEEHLTYPPASGVLPAKLDLPLRTALSKTASQRFSTCTEMVQQVIGCSAAVPTTSQQWSAKFLATQTPTPPPLPPGPPPPPPRPWPPFPRFVIFLAGALLLILGITFSVAYSLTGNQNKDLNGGEYIGELSNGLANGQGTWTSPDGLKYTGEFKDDKRNGQGTLTLADGTTATGEWQDNKLNGQGTITFADGGRYNGEFKDDNFNGQGTRTYANRDKYTGEFKDDKRNGQGTLTFPDGAKYTGEFKDDKFNGQGTWTSPDGNKYTGEWQDNKLNGQGTLTFPDGSTKTGEWQDKKLNGQGTYTWPNGDKYTGAFKDSLFNGLGTYTFADGGTYTGEFKDDLFNGQGTYTFADGSTKTGEWAKGEFVRK